MCMCMYVCMYTSWEEVSSNYIFQNGTLSAKLCRGKREREREKRREIRSREGYPKRQTDIQQHIDAQSGTVYEYASYTYYLHTHTHIRTKICTHIQTHIHIHTHNHVHAYTHTHTYTYTYTYA